MDWTPPPRGTGRDPELSKVIEQIKQRIPSFKKARGLWMAVAVALVLILGSTAYYTVDPEETGVVLRFGRYIRESGPGLHFKLPLGVETVSLIKTGRVYKSEFGFRGVAPGIRSRFTEKGYQDESLMLTGDLNVIDVKWIVQFQIRDPRKWLFAVRDGMAAIRDLSQAVMRSIVGNRYSDEVLTLSRVEIAAQAQKELQALLDSYQTGVKVITVKLQDVNPPPPVQPAFNEVNEARQQKERMINVALEAYNHQIPTARGNAKRMIPEAEGYATERVNRAQGEAKRFNDVYRSYAKAKEVTKRRFYLEAMQKTISSAAEVYVVDTSIKGLLPFMDLTKGKGLVQGKGVSK
jgi:membrane protease subunit HflK